MHKLATPEVFGSTTTSSSCGEPCSPAVRPARFVLPVAATGLSFSLAGDAADVLAEVEAADLLEAAATSSVDGFARKKEVIM